MVLAAAVLERSRMYRYPFTPYPNGWFRVAYSSEVRRGEIVNATFFGRELVIFRGEDDVARVLDAHCPHLGAHLGVGGEVKGNRIECPFHGWRFDGSGQCVEIPYCKKVPKKAKTPAWTVRELNGMIFVFHHAAGAEPSFDLPEVPAVTDPKWSDFIDFSWDIRVHIQEIAENALDLAHFEKVHHYLDIPALNEFDIEDHTFRINLDSARKVMGVVGRTNIEITYHGLGVVYAVIHSGPVDLRVILTSTPIDLEHVQVRIAVMFDKRWNPLRNLAVRRFLAKEISTDFAHDIPLWENKAYHERPVLCRDDGPIMAIRKWAEQFYAAEAGELVQLPRREDKARPAMQVAQ